MAQNKTQFQKGFSLLEFMEKFGTGEQCLEAIFQQRWPQGFSCPTCGNTTFCRIRVRNCQCHHCHAQVSITSGTVFHSSNLPLTKWFLAIFLLSSSKNGISALELSRQIGVSYKTAWRMKHKLMQVMNERKGQNPLTGRIEVDDAYLGGRRKNGKRGRGSENKIPFLAAVETNSTRRPLRIKLRKINGFTKYEAKKWKETHTTGSCQILSDGLTCLRALAKEGGEFHILKTEKGQWTTQIPDLKWVNTILGNLKNALKSTYKAFRNHYIQRYLSEFEYRFNYRGDLSSIFKLLLCDSITTPPLPMKFLRVTGNST